MARDTGLNSRDGVVIRINENIIYNWVFNCGSGTNTIAELLGAWVLLAFAVQLDILEFYV